VDAAKANIFGFNGCVTGFLNTSIVNVGDDDADAIPTELLLSPMGVTGPSEDADEDGDGESEWNGEGGVLGGDMYRVTVDALTDFRRGTCCSFCCS
jgi:hypothetical protein